MLSLSTADPPSGTPLNGRRREATGSHDSLNDNSFMDVEEIMVNLTGGPVKPPRSVCEQGFEGRGDWTPIELFGTTVEDWPLVIQRLLMAA